MDASETIEMPQALRRRRANPGPRKTAGIGAPLDGEGRDARREAPEAAIPGECSKEDEGLRTWRGLEELRGVLRSCLTRHCLDEHEVDDVIQETYLRAVRYRGKLKEGARLRSWTLRIAMNVLADRRRRERRYVPTTEEELEPRAMDALRNPNEPSLRIGRFEVEEDQALGLLHRALSTLRESDRRLLDSFYGGQGSCRATAQECDVAPGLVKVRLFRARRRLCRAMRHRLALERVAPGEQQLSMGGAR